MITLNRPATLNALTMNMINKLGISLPDGLRTTK